MAHKIQSINVSEESYRAVKIIASVRRISNHMFVLGHRRLTHVPQRIKPSFELEEKSPKLINPQSQHSLNRPNG
jgi:hypothetical protein